MAFTYSYHMEELLLKKVQNMLEELKDPDMFTESRVKKIKEMSDIIDKLLKKDTSD